MKISTLPLEMIKPGNAGEAKKEPSADQKSFAGILTDALGEVNALQNQSALMKQQLVAGQITDVHQVTLAAEKAGIAFQLTMQIRNKVVEAYQEIMRMQV